MEEKQKKEKYDANLGDAVDQFRVVDERGAGWSQDYADHNIGNDQGLPGIQRQCRHDCS